MPPMNSRTATTFSLSAFGRAVPVKCDTLTQELMAENHPLLTVTAVFGHNETCFFFFFNLLVS